MGTKSRGIPPAVSQEYHWFMARGVLGDSPGSPENRIRRQPAGLEQHEPSRVAASVLLTGAIGRLKSVRGAIRHLNAVHFQACPGLGFMKLVRQPENVLSGWDRVPEE